MPSMPSPSRPRPGYRTRIAGLVCTLVFLLLLSHRLDWWARTGHLPETAPTAPAAAQEVWMAIFQSDRQLGYAHRRLTPMGEGYRVTDVTQMRVNTMGLTQPLRAETQARLGPDMSLRQFEFQLESGRFAFKAQGRVKDRVLEVVHGSQTLKIPLSEPIHLAGGIWAKIAAGQWQPGQKAVYQVFDPATMGRRPVTVHYRGPEPLQWDGREHPARRFELDFMGAQQTAWIDADGRVLKESGLLNLSLVRTTRRQALGHTDDQPVVDMTRLASVDAGTLISDPLGLQRLRLRIDGIDRPYDLDGGRQALAGDELTITREPPPAGPGGQPVADADRLPGPMIPSDHPRIRAEAQRIVAGAGNPAQKARRLVRWVFAQVEKKPVISVPDALEVLENRTGDCNEHAVLLAALARAVDIPARVEAGLVYLDGRFFYHAWNALYVGHWVTADALMNQMPADVTHIRIVSGDARRQLDLIGVMGNIRLEILDAS